jgi:hypothetical protein
LEYSFVSYYFTRRTFHCLRHHHGQRSQQFGRRWNGGQREEEKKQPKQKKKQLMTMRVMMTAEEEEEGHVGIGQNGMPENVANLEKRKNGQNMCQMAKDGTVRGGGNIGVELWHYSPLNLVLNSAQP